MVQHRAGTIGRGGYYQQHHTCAAGSAVVRAERVFHGTVPARVSIGALAHICARVLIISPFCCPVQIVRRQRRERGGNSLKMAVSHSRVTYLNAEWEFAVIFFLHRSSLPSLTVHVFRLRGGVRCAT